MNTCAILINIEYVKQRTEYNIRRLQTRVRKGNTKDRYSCYGGKLMSKLTKKERIPNKTGNTHNEVDLLSTLKSQEIKNATKLPSTHEVGWNTI